MKTSSSPKISARSKKARASWRKKSAANPTRNLSRSPRFEPSRNLPEPKIIDASVPAPARKPTLEELKASKKKVNAPPLAPGLRGIHLENYELPSLDLLDPADDSDRVPTDPAELKATQEVHHRHARAVQHPGQPPATLRKARPSQRYELYPAKGVRVDRIVALERDIARATRAERINILAPIPGKDTVGIEIANTNKVKVTLRELFETDAWGKLESQTSARARQGCLRQHARRDLAQMPHCLVAGTTGSGKSVVQSTPSSRVSSSATHRRNCASS